MKQKNSIEHKMLMKEVIKSIKILMMLVITMKQIKMISGDDIEHDNKQVKIDR